MKSKNIIISLISGFIIGFVVRDRLSHLQKLTPEKALQYAKDTFQQHSPINGSWIYMKPKKLEKNGLIYDTYQGGISKNIDGINKQFEFFSDVETGTIIDVRPID